MNPASATSTSTAKLAPSLVKILARIAEHPLYLPRNARQSSALIKLISLGLVEERTGLFHLPGLSSNRGHFLTLDGEKAVKRHLPISPAEIKAFLTFANARGSSAAAVRSQASDLHRRALFWARSFDPRHGVSYP